MKLDKSVFEPVFERTIEINDLDDSMVLSCLTEKGQRAIPTCPGDIYKTVNVLMDYSRLLDLAVEQWGIEGFQKAVYEIHAEQYRALAKKYASGIGYDYEMALKKCQKKMEQQKKDLGMGEDALVLMVGNTETDRKEP